MERCGDVGTVSYREGPARQFEPVIDKQVMQQGLKPVRIVDEGLDMLARTVEITDLGLAVQVDR